MTEPALKENLSIVQRAQQIRQTAGSAKAETDGRMQKNGLYINRPQGRIPLNRQKPGSYVRILPKQELVISPAYYRRIAGKLLFYGIILAALVILIIVLRKAGLFNF